MSHINKIETESIQVGLADAPPIAGVDLWPSMDPTVPFSLQTFGTNNHLALTNQIGLYNGIGLQSITGLSSLLGFKTGLGGQANAEPKNTNACPLYEISAATGKLLGGWTLNGSAICVAPCSDISLKKNITPLKNSLDKVLNLQGVSFDWKEELIPYLVQYEGVHQVGLIAQEVEQVAPELVGNTNIEGNEAKTVKYQNLTALLVEAIKEQQEQINTLKQTVQELSTKLENCCP